MIRWQAVVGGALGVALSIVPAQAQSAARYRDFQLGGDLLSVSASAGVPASEAKTMHARPAMLQALEWRRPYGGGSAAAGDPVQQIAFSFYNDQLFRLVIDYDRERTAGMTDADMIDAISEMYGTPVKLASKTGRASLGTIDEESGTRIGGWRGGEYVAVLYRSSYASGFRLLVLSPRLDALARTAEAQALRLDERDAPQREQARQKKEADDERASNAKARVANKAAFKP